MTAPRVVSLKGRKPQTLGDNEVYIGHRCTRGGWDLPESRWANPFRVRRDGTREQVIAKYAAWLVDQPELMAALPELRGKDLACWCAPAPCHGDVLLRLAND